MLYSALRLMVLPGQSPTILSLPKFGLATKPMVTKAVSLQLVLFFTINLYTPAVLILVGSGTATPAFVQLLVKPAVVYSVVRLKKLVIQMLIFLSAPKAGFGFTCTVTFVFNGQLPDADELSV